ncbi:MAG TPA: hypothetical protein PKA53_03320 [Sphingobacterium sp.]|nr:hypothetical protein [Sphingobacterium sp.]
MQEAQNTPETLAGASPPEVIAEGKTIAIITYLTLIGLVVALVMNGEKKNTYAKFHIRQALGLMLTGFATMFVSWIPLIGWLFGIVAFFFLLFLWFTGLFNALNGREKALPVLGDKYAEWFKSV